MIFNGQGLSTSAAETPIVHRAARHRRPLTWLRWSPNIRPNDVLVLAGIALVLLQQSLGLDLTSAERVRFRVPRHVERERVDLAQQGRALVPRDAVFEVGVVGRPPPIRLEQRAAHPLEAR